MAEDVYGHCQRHNRGFVLKNGCPECLAERTITAYPPTVTVTPATRAQIAIRPDQDESVIKLYEEGVRLRDFALVAKIETAEDVKKYTNDLAILAGLLKSIEEKRKGYTGPINEHLKAVNEAFKEFRAPMDKANELLRGKVKTYDAKERARKEEQERINRLKIEAAQAEQKLNGELTDSVDLVEVTEPPKSISSSMGTAGMVDRWCVNVEDFALLPAEYKTVDYKKLNAVVRAGLRSIPGCKIWNDPSVRVTARGGDNAG